jgi:hypothetical protein
MERLRNSVFISALAAVIVMACSFRIFTVFQGLPFSEFTDEVGGVAGTLVIGATRSLKVNLEHGYPSFYNYLLAACYGMIYLAGRLGGAFRDTFDFALLYMTNPRTFYLAARVISCSAGLAAILAVYRTARICDRDNRYAAPISAALLSLSMVHAELSRIGKVDALMVCFAAWYIYHLVRVQYGDTHTRRFILLGICFGCAVATKVSAIPLVIAAPVVLFIRTRRAGEALFSPEVIKGTVVSAVTSVAVFFLANPAFLVSYRKAVEITFGEATGAKLSVFSAGGAPAQWIWIAQYLVRHEQVIGVLFMTGVCYGMFELLSRKNPRFLPMLLVIAFYVAYIGSWSKTSLHYLLAIYPLLALLGGVALARGAAAFPSSGRNRLAEGVIIILLAVGLFHLGSWSFRQSLPSTRMIAKQWMERNIPSGSFIAYDDYSADPPFFSPDLYLNPGTRTKFEQFVPPPLKERILEYALQHPSFKSVRLRQYLEQPVFPVQWTPDYRKLFEGDSMITHFYKMQFTPLSELHRQGVAYIIVSDGYFNDFAAGKYPADNPFFGFNEAGLDYHRQLFEANGFYARFREIEPDNSVVGPRITIFKRVGI